MDEQDRRFIEALFEKQGEQFQRQFSDLSERFDQKLADVPEESKRHVSAISESFDLKIGMLAEGHSLLTEKLERIETQMDQMNSRIDRVELSLTQKLNQIAADVAAHRADTEVHSEVYSVREEHPQYTAIESDAD